MHDSDFERIQACMQYHDFCVISSVNNEGRSQSAFVAFSHQGLDVFVGTSAKSRKYSNIITDPHVSIVIADEDAEIQYEGIARVVSDEDRLAIEDRHCAKLPGSAKYRDDPDEVYLHIRPTWIRFVQHGDSDQISEYTEFFNED